MRTFLALLALLFPLAASAQEATPQAALPQATVTYQDMSSAEDGFIIQRQCTGETAFVEVGRVAANVTTFINTLDPTLAGKTCAYRAAAFNAGGQSGWSNVDSCLVPQPVLEPPMNLKVAQ